MDIQPLPTIDLDAYLARIGYASKLSPTAETLRALNVAHLASIPFENLNIMLGLPIRLDLESLQAKLVRDRRGGYCFEQNALFARALEQLGFPVTRLAARVHFGATGIQPRCHMLLKVEAGGQPWLVDVGFGGFGLAEPIPLSDGTSVHLIDADYLLERDADEWLLIRQTSEGRNEVYSFNLERQHPVDYVTSNHYCATSPDSLFTQVFIVQRVIPQARYLLTNRRFSILEASSATTRTLDDDSEVLAVLAEHFGLVFPPETSFRIPEDRHPV